VDISALTCVTIHAAPRRNVKIAAQPVAVQPVATETLLCRGEGVGNRVETMVGFIIGF
jgi:hypothetical protein